VNLGITGNYDDNASDYYCATSTSHASPRVHTSPYMRFLCSHVCFQAAHPDTSQGARVKVMYYFCMSRMTVWLPSRYKVRHGSAVDKFMLGYRVSEENLGPKQRRLMSNVKMVTFLRGFDEGKEKMCGHWALLPYSCF